MVSIMCTVTTKTAVVYADVPLQLKAEFYKVAIERKGNKRGIISEAVKEAMELWVATSPKKGGQ